VSLTRWATEHGIADPGDDRREAIGVIAAGGAKAVIPPRSNRTEPRASDKHRAKAGNVVERFGNQVKNGRRGATRSEKTSRNPMAFWQLASIMVRLA
jgi:transposase